MYWAYVPDFLLHIDETNINKTQSLPLRPSENAGVDEHITYHDRCNNKE